MKLTLQTSALEQITQATFDLYREAGVPEGPAVLAHLCHTMAQIIAITPAESRDEVRTFISRCINSFLEGPNVEH